MASPYLHSVECSYQPLGFAFHPTNDHLLAAGLVDGSLEVHDVRKGDDDDADEDEHDSILSSIELHTQKLPQKDSKELKPAACRSVIFSSDGTRIYTGGTAGDLCGIDAEMACKFSASGHKKSILWQIDPATEGEYNPLHTLYAFEKSPTIVSGDETGGVRVWDERMLGSATTSTSAMKRPHGCVLSWNENDDYMSAIQASKDENTLLATSADGRLAVFDLRMARSGTNTHKKPYRLSDDLEDELLSLQIMKNGKKVVCGTQQGVLGIFSWGTWGDVSDRFPGHPHEISSLLKVDEDTLLTGSSDGLIRVVQIQPDKLLGVLGDDHGGFPIEKLAFNSNRHLVGSLSHDSYVRLWDGRLLDEEYEPEDDEKGEENATEAQLAQSSVARKRSAPDNSDDEWEDEDDGDDDDNGDGNDSDDDSDESDDSDAKPPAKNQKRQARLKTENEKFFDDL